MGKIFYLMGKSACGKDSIYSILKERCPWLHTYVMYTTRPMRDGETEGTGYRFTDEAGIEGFRTSGRLIEARTYHTVRGPWIYATVDDGQIDLKSGDYLTAGVLSSYIGVRDYFGAASVIPLYIEVEDGERLMRAIRREQQQEIPRYKEMCRRFIADSEDFSEDKLREAGIDKRYVNDDLERCISELTDVIMTSEGRAKGAGL